MRALAERLASAPGADRAERRAIRTRLVGDALTELAGDAGLTTAGVALAAVGSYGREELSPYSDLDLLLVFSPQTPESYVELLAERLWYPIWDAGIRLDHSTRTIGGARQLARRDLAVLLGLVQMRHIAGDPVVTAELTRSVLADWRADAPTRLPALREWSRRRVEQWGELAYSAVPDLKRSGGGLQDLAVLRAVAASWVADFPHAGLAAARTDLLDVRDALRELTGRAVDRVQVQDQDALAAHLGLADRDDVLRRIAGIGRAVAHATGLTWYRVERELRTGARRGRSPVRTPLADDVVRQDDEALPARSADRSDPTLALRLAAAAATSGIPAAPSALAALAPAAAAMPVPWPEPARRALLTLLGSGPPLVDAWEALDQAGVVSAVLPGWDRLRSLPQRDPVHRHTVDRHLMQTVVEASRLVRRVARPDLLLLGALLHDVGKGTGRDHSVAGADVARDWMRHMGFPPDDVTTVTALVRYHLLLAETAVRRDPDDPQTVRTVAHLAGSARTLTLLDALTEADARAAGPLAWTPWKAGQVRVLAARALALLDGRAEPPTSAGVDVGAASPIAARPAQAVTIQIVPAPTIVTVTVEVPDRPGLLAAATGVFALHRLAIRSAAVSVTDGRARQQWAVTPRFGDGPDPAALRADLQRALAGRWDVAAAMAGRGAPTSVEGQSSADPVVRVVPDASRRSTVLEIRCRDAPALAFVVATAMSQTADVVAARVDTFGADAVDTFYLQSGGRPLESDRCEAVVRAVRVALAPLQTPPTGRVR